MRQSRRERDDCRRIAEELGLTEMEVSKVVKSFFDVILSAADKLPFDNESRIYSRKKFEEYVFAYNIPSIGRIGPVYSRYVKWRANEAKSLTQTPRSHCRRRISQDEIEHMASEILAGRTPPPISKKRNDYRRVWVVGQDKKKLARQVIKKDENGF